jgi:hypothetical protein
MKRFLLVICFLALLNDYAGFAQSGIWTKLNPIGSHNDDFFYPRYRSGSGLAKLVDGKILLFGGNGGNKTNNDTWIFDLKLNTWTKIQTMNSPPPRRGHGFAQLYDGKILLFGGESGQDMIYDDTWIFDINKMDWENMNPIKHPSSRYGFGMSTLSDGKVIIFGGDILTDSSGYKYGDETWIYDASINSWKEYKFNSKGTPTKRFGTGMAQLSDGKVLMFGGSISIMLNDTWLFEEEQNKWIELFPKNNPEGLFSMALSSLIDDYILLYGGTHWGAATDSTWIFSLKDTNWYKIENSQDVGKRAFHSLSQIENGKAILTCFQEFDDTWLFEIDSNFIYVKDYQVCKDFEIFYKNDNLIIYFNDFNKNDIDIKIYNLNGTELLSQNIPSGLSHYKIDISNFTTAVYFVRLYSGKEIFVKEFVKY